MHKHLLAAVLSLAVAMTGASALEAHAKTTFVTIGTGGITGVYYPTGGAIAKIVNAKKDKYDIRATVESTGASVFNINAIMAGDLEFGIAQADRQYQAYNGLSEWEGKPQKDLRAVFALAPEAVTFVAAEDSGIKSLKDAKGKVVNIGNPGSGNRQNAIDVFEAAGINIEKDLKAESIKAADAPRMLQDGRIDGFFYTVGHPNGNIKEATAGKRKTRIVSITDIEPLVKKFPYYSLTNIDMAQYPEATNANEKVTTVGMLATFVTSAKVPDDVVYASSPLQSPAQSPDQKASVHRTQRPSRPQIPLPQPPACALPGAAPPAVPALPAVHSAARPLPDPSALS